MLPMLFPIDARDYPFRRSHREPGTATGATAERGRRERDQLAADNARLADEVRRLKEENESLRACSEIWIRLYERQLARANAAEPAPARSQASEPLA